MSTSLDQAVTDALCVLCENEDEAVLGQIRSLEPKIGRRYLSDSLIARWQRCPERLLNAMDVVLDAEASSAENLKLEPTPTGLTEAMWFAVGQSRVCVWQGDIRTLHIGAVVNAANEQGLGCFQPTHVCIDNILHRAAGPRMREECRLLMEKRDEPLSAGAAPLLTAGYHLHASNVLHVTGPQIAPRGREPRPVERVALAQCYRGCLDAAAAAGICSVAFPCISAGLFGYPAAAAAEVAMTTVRDWLLADESRAAAFDAIVLDVFAETDRDAYATLAPQILGSEAIAAGGLVAAGSC